MNFLGILGAISGLGGILGGGAKAAADGRMTEAQLRAIQDRTRTDQYGIGQQAQMQQGTLDLARKNFEEDARGGRARQAMIGDLLANFKPTSISVPGIESAQISGGLQLGEGGKAGASEMMRQALLKQLQGDTFEGGKILQAPGTQGIPQAGLLEKIGGIAGLGGAIAGGIGQFFPQSAPSVPGIPGMAGPPSQAPGVQVPGVGIPDAPPALSLQDIIQQIGNINKRSVNGGLG